MTGRGSAPAGAAEAVLAAAADLGYTVDVRGDGALLWLPGSPFRLHLQTQSDTALLYLAVQTDSAWHGARGDLNDGLALWATAVLSAAGIASCAVVNIPHPAVDLSDAEVYASHVWPEQPNALFSAREKEPPPVSSLLPAAITLARVVHDAMQHREDFPAPPGLFDTQPMHDAWAELAASAVNSTGEPAGTHSTREAAAWSYYRDARTGAVVVRQAALAAALQAAHSEPTTLRVRAGTLHLNRDLRSYLPTGSHRRALSSIAALTPKHLSPVVVPTAGFVVATSNDHMVFLPANAGEHAHDRAADALRRRHEAEAQFLGSNSRLVWADRIDPGQFETLVAELARHQPGWQWVRAAGPTHQPDGGTDLLARVVLAAPNDSKDPGAVPVREVLMVVQCKPRARPSAAKCRTSATRWTSATQAASSSRQPEPFQSDSSLA